MNHADHGHLSRRFVSLLAVVEDHPHYAPLASIQGEQVTASDLDDNLRFNEPAESSVFIGQTVIRIDHHAGEPLVPLLPVIIAESPAHGSQHVQRPVITLQRHVHLPQVREGVLPLPEGNNHRIDVNLWLDLVYDSVLVPDNEPLGKLCVDPFLVAGSHVIRTFSHEGGCHVHPLPPLQQGRHFRKARFIVFIK